MHLNQVKLELALKLFHLLILFVEVRGEPRSKIVDRVLILDSNTLQNLYTVY